MQTISIINPKGGCGKTTVATSLAALLAGEGHTVALRDMDRQLSSREWLNRRPSRNPPITPLVNGAQQLCSLTFGCNFVIQDTQSAVYDYDLLRLLIGVDVAVVPVGPSCHDLDVSARFVERLRQVPRVMSRKCKIFLLGSRWPVDDLELPKAWNQRSALPLESVLSDSPAYRKAMAAGLGVFELDEPDQPQLLDSWTGLLARMKTLSSVEHVQGPGEG